MKQQVENVDRPGQIAVHQHPHLFKNMWLRNKWRQPEEDCSDQQKRIWDVMEKFHFLNPFFPQRLRDPEKEQINSYGLNHNLDIG